MPRLEATIKPLELVLTADVDKATAWVVLGNVVTRLELVAHAQARVRLVPKNEFHAQCKGGIQPGVPRSGAKIKF